MPSLFLLPAILCVLMAPADTPTTLPALLAPLLPLVMLCSVARTIVAAAAAVVVAAAAAVVVAAAAAAAAAVVVAVAAAAVLSRL